MPLGFGHDLPDTINADSCASDKFAFGFPAANVKVLGGT
jgi:hypothetical protein